MAQDLCVNAEVIAALPFSVVGLDISAATQSGDDPKPGTAGSGAVPGNTAVFHTVWYKWTPAIDVTVQLAVTDGDVSMSVWTGACGALTEVISYFDRMTFRALGGTPYFIMVGSFGAVAPAPFTFTIAESTDAPNQLMITAELLSSWPAVVSLSNANATDLSPRELWYRYVAGTDDTVLGLFAYGTAMRADIFIAPVNYYYNASNLTAVGIFATNKALQFPVVPGATYYIRLQANASQTFAVTRSASPVDPAPVGSIFVNDDTAGFPLAILSQTDGAVLRFVTPFPNGEAGDVLDDGTILVEDAANSRTQLYDGQLTLLATIPTRYQRISTNKTTKFYVGNPGGGAVHASATTISAAGVAGPTTWTFPAVGLTGLAPSDDETILYYTGQSSSANAAIKRWDLVNNIALTDLVAGNGASYTTTDLFVLEDSSILALYFKSTVTRDTLVKRYDATGALLNTYSFGAGNSATTTPRLARAIDDPTSFWIWLHTSGGLSTFQNVRVSDGVVLTTISRREFETGVYFGTETATPDALFGHSFSCPFLILREAIIPTPPIPPLPNGCPANNLAPRAVSPDHGCAPSTPGVS